MLFSRLLTTSLLAAPLLFGVAAVSPASAHTITRAPHVVHATIHGYAFGPKRLVIALGTKVVWTNKDGTNHTVTGDSGNHVHFASRTLSKGHSFSFIFKKVGTFRYHCAYHPFMLGVVVVHKKK